MARPAHRPTAGPDGSSTTRGPEGGRASREVEAMAAAWERGERVTAADVLGRHPDLDDEAAIRLIYEEACLRREAGLAVDTSEVVRRHPRWGDELRDLFDCDRLLRSPGAVPACPDVGESLGPFRLLDELGRGASGRTYLAADLGLAGRPVVVKVMPDDQDEYLALAGLRHTHIVPLFSEHTFPERGLRALCMPYLGGASLARILGDLAAVPQELRSGKLLVDAIDRNTAAAPAPPPADGPFRRGLEESTYVRAVARVVACLADALRYAHERGLVHMDLKPSNVLIAADGQPVLLDFHLARGPIRPGESVTGRVGGTPGWMSPEQQSAMDAVREGRPVSAAVDGRTDIFALGLLLREAVAAHGPAPGRERGDVRAGIRFPPGVSVGFADIVRKCLSPDPADRYEDAALLAEDLRRHLDDLPLRGVGNRSPVERWRKWRRRRPAGLAWGLAAFALLLAGAAALTVPAAAYRRRVGRIQVALDDGRAYLASGRPDEAIRTLSRGLEAAGSLPAAGGMARALGEELLRARRARLAGELHELADRIRFRYGVDLPGQEEARSLAGHCRAIWDRRDRLVAAREGPPGAGTRKQIETDLLELAAVWADLRVGPASPPDAAAARLEALRVLGEAEALFGPSPAIDARRDRIDAELGHPPTPRKALRGPGSPWEHYDLGRYHLRSGRLEAAAAEFARTLDLRPQDFWSNFYQGLCAFRLGRHGEAAAAFRACIALRPDSATCRFNRARAYDALGRIDEAYLDYTRAIGLDPALSAAALLNRGLLSYRRGRHPEAVADFTRALALRPLEPGTAGQLHYNLALALLARGDHTSALASAEAAADRGCPEARLLRDDLRGGRHVIPRPTGPGPVR